jgi:hypothetical protein
MEEEMMNLILVLVESNKPLIITLVRIKIRDKIKIMPLQCLAKGCLVVEIRIKIKTNLELKMLVFILKHHNL